MNKTLELDQMMSSAQLRDELRSTQAKLLHLTRMIELQEKMYNDAMGNNFNAQSNESIAFMNSTNQKMLQSVPPPPLSRFYSTHPSPRNNNPPRPFKKRPSRLIESVNEEHLPTANQAIKTAPELYFPPAPPLANISSCSKIDREESNANKIQPHDVLFGRGAFTNNRPGNVFFRSLVAQAKASYEEADHASAFKNKRKHEIAVNLVRVIKEQCNSRFWRIIEAPSDGKESDSKKKTTSPTSAVVELHTSTVNPSSKENYWFHIVDDAEAVKKTKQALRDAHKSGAFQDLAYRSMNMPTPIPPIQQQYHSMRNQSMQSNMKNQNEASALRIFQQAMNEIDQEARLQQIGKRRRVNVNQPTHGNKSKKLKTKNVIDYPGENERMKQICDIASKRIENISS